MPKLGLIFTAIALALGFSPMALASDSAVEGSCTAIDLRNDLIQGKSEELRQGSKGWCYAFSTAVSVSQVLGEEVSVLDIALHYNFNNTEKPIEQITANDLYNTQTGIVTYAANDMASKGFCLANHLPWNTKMNSQIRASSAKDLIRKIDQACGERKQIDWRMRAIEGTAGLPVINNQLEMGLIPIISADDGLFFWASTGLDAKNNAQHVVNVVGRKYNSALQSCEYILRDSFRNSAATDGLRSPRYEGGYMYATESQIQKYLSAIYYLQNINGNQKIRGAYNVHN